eukprot:TRINITY_DN3875_c0_g1_i1.p1 TRINITY_DN3875_c0_g1~~TRINITY_DN3875_c0_g1_i1.p1  ORF type:complete len:253 (-),score=31.00 TRINITY_DN3875_c0_g1_i1:973-1704(-)
MARHVTPREYVQLFNAGVPVGELTGIYGRIMKGPPGCDFSTLTDGPMEKDPTCFLMDSAGMSQCIGRSTYDTLVVLGFEEDYIREKVSRQYTWQLGVLPASDDIQPATWDGVAHVLRYALPDIAPHIHTHLPVMKTSTFDELQSQADHDFNEVRAVGESHPKYLLPLRMRELMALREPTHVDVRAFLYYSCGIRKLFTGDGYTKTFSGERGVPEYLMPNKLRATMPELEIIHLEPPQIPRSCE